MTEFTQVYTRPNFFLLGRLLSKSIKEGPIKCATVCDKSWVILTYVYFVTKTIHKKKEYVKNTEGFVHLSKNLWVTIFSTFSIFKIGFTSLTLHFKMIQLQSLGPLIAKLQFVKGLFLCKKCTTWVLLYNSVQGGLYLVMSSSWDFPSWAEPSQAGALQFLSWQYVHW